MAKSNENAGGAPKRLAFATAALRWVDQSLAVVREAPMHPRYAAQLADDFARLSSQATELGLLDVAALSASGTFIMNSMAAGGRAGRITCATLLIELGKSLSAVQP